MPTAAVTGAGGLVGRALGRTLTAHGWRVVPLVRRRAHPGEIHWDPAAGRIDAPGLEGLDAVVHLAGEPIGVRWTPARRRRIRTSRVDATRLLAGALAARDRPPPVLITASAVGIYGNRGDELLTEESPTGEGFLAQLGRDWEAAADPAREAGIRVVHARFAIVLSPEGGALRQMLLPFRLALGGRLGPGTQWTSWISLPDVVDVLQFLLETPALDGPVNVGSPAPVTNREFARVLGAALHRPAVLPIPSFVLELLFGQMARDTLLASQRMVPARLTAAGYTFRHGELMAALRALLG